MKLFRSLSKFNATTVLLRFLLSFLCFFSTDAYDALDPNGNITIKWDVISWTPDGYVFLAEKNPKCCVSLTSSYNDTIIPCPTCACGCENNVTKPGTCVNPEAPHLSSTVSDHGMKNFTPLVQCTDHMCPVGIHWHVKLSYKDYWRVKITITNFNYHMNYTQWNLFVQHPHLDNITQLFSINYKSLVPNGVTNDLAMFWGVKSDNDLVMKPGPLGNVQFELLLRKDASNFTFDKGCAFPNRVYFNGDNCAMPPPDAHPHLSNGVSVMPPPYADPHLRNAVCQWKISLLKLLVTLLSSMAFFFAYI